MRIRIICLVFILSGASQALAASKGKMVHSIRVPEVKVDLKEGAGREKTAGYCAVCHSLDYITTQPRLSKEKWGESVTKMIKVYGAAIPKDVADEITSYLATAYGKDSQ